MQTTVLSFTCGGWMVNLMMSVLDEQPAVSKAVAALRAGRVLSSVTHV